MSIAELNIVKNWPAGSVVKEDNWGEFKSKLEAWALKTRSNLYQLGKDAFGSDYEYNNDGNATVFQGNIVITSNISGANIDNVIIGNTTPAAGTFTSLTYETSKTKYYNVSALELIIQDPPSNVADWYVYEEGDVRKLINNDSGFAERTFNKGVHLPHGAIVTKVTVYFARDDASSSMTTTLKRETLSDGTIATMASVSASDSSGDIVSEEDTSISNSTIDNDTYDYFVEVAINNNNSVNDIEFNNIVIEYTITTPQI